MADKKLIIADGHHRYETSVAYAKERSAQLKLPLNQPARRRRKPHPTAHLPSHPPFPEAAMMMTFVNMDAPGITILPTHRVVHGSKTSPRPTSSPKPAPSTTSPNSTSPHLTSSLTQPITRHSFIAATGDGNYLLTPKPEAIAPAPEDLPPRQRQLGVAQLHTRRPRPPPRPHRRQHPRNSATSSTSAKPAKPSRSSTSGEANIAFLIKPITLDQLKDVSLSGDVMPQKSTDFYPKLLSGLAIYALD